MGLVFPRATAESGQHGKATPWLGDPTPIVPALGQYYAFTSDLAYLVVRVTAGVFAFLHGWTKVTEMSHAGLTGFSRSSV